MAVRVLCALLLLIVGCGSASTPPRARPARAARPGLARITAPPSCHLHGSGLASTPDRRCTPGAWIADPDMSTAHVCATTYNPRPAPTITGALKRRALAEYGLPAGATGYEADHLFPLWLGGATTIANIWPEKDYTHPLPYQLNPKDELEFAIYRMTCSQHALTVAAARRIFRLRWTTAYKRYVGTIADR